MFSALLHGDPARPEFQNGAGELHDEDRNDARSDGGAKCRIG